MGNSIKKNDAPESAPLATAEDFAAFTPNTEIDASDIEIPEILLFQNQNEEKAGAGHAKGVWVNTITKSAIGADDRIIPLHVQPQTIVWDEKAKKDGIEWPIFTCKRPEMVPDRIRDSVETVIIEGETRPRYAIDIGYFVFVILNDEPIPYIIRCLRTSKKAAKQLNILLMGRLGAGKGPGMFRLESISKPAVKGGRNITYYNPRFILTDEPMTATQAQTAIGLIPAVRKPPAGGWNVDDHEAMSDADREAATPQAVSGVSGEKETVKLPTEDEIPF